MPYLTGLRGLGGFLRAEMRGMRAEFKTDLQTRETRQNKQFEELKADLRPKTCGQMEPTLM